jgi:hypothetical protein
MFNDNTFSITPVNFFSLRCKCHYWNGKGALDKKHRLPSTATLCSEEPFAEVSMGWNEEGIAIQVEVDKAVDQSFYPAIERGDAVELFIDTRDLKSASFNTRFCHHFFFLPEAVDGKTAGEITRFRTEDSHPLCPAADLRVTTHAKRSSYTLNIFLPAHCLVGYDPDQFDRLGFTYRIHRVGGDPQHFSVSSSEYAIDQQPSLWSSVELVP